MTPAESHVLACAHTYAAADRAEVEARNAYKLAQRNHGALAAKVGGLQAAMLNAEDATREARSALHRATRNLSPQESKFDITGAP